MPQTREEISTNLAERLCWQVARRDGSRVARRLYRKQVVDGVYLLDEGALLDDSFYFLPEQGGQCSLYLARSSVSWRSLPRCFRNPFGNRSKFSSREPSSPLAGGP
jgi:hypothetical protein